MRRDVLIQAVRRLSSDIKTSNVMPMFEQAFERSRRDKTDEPSVDFEVFQKLSVNYDRYDKAITDIIAIFDLQDIYLPSFWARIVVSPDPAILYHTRNNLLFFSEHAQKIIKLLDFSSVEKVPVSDQPTDQFITMILPEDDGVTTSPDRLIRAIESVTGLYEVVSAVNYHDGTKLSIVSLDSGSDKAVTFIGAGDIAKSVRGIISDIWDRVILGKKTQSAADISLIAGALPVFATISEQEATGTLQREEAEILRRTLLKSATGVVMSGAITTDIETRSLPTPRALVQQRQLLLTAPADVSVGNGDRGAEPDRPARDSAIEELRAELQALKASQQLSNTEPGASPARPDAKKRR